MVYSLISCSPRLGWAVKLLSLLNNGTTSAMLRGDGAPEFAFNGILMFGILISNLLILNEGAKEVDDRDPGLIGFVVGTVVLDVWVENGSSEAQSLSFRS